MRWRLHARDESHLCVINSIFQNNALYFRKQQEQEGNARPSLGASLLLLPISSGYSTLAYATLVNSARLVTTYSPVVTPLPL